MPPLTVLHVCMGNICRSPMAERLLAAAVGSAAGLPAAQTQELVRSHSVGTGGWHVGKQMDSSAARQVRARGGDPDGFTARQLRAEQLDAADLVLTATADQQHYVAGLRPDATERTFVLGELARLLRQVTEQSLPPPGASPQQVYARGVALVAAAGAARGGAEPLPGDDLDDPWGRGEKTFTRVADEIEDRLRPLAAALLAPVA